MTEQQRFIRSRLINAIRRLDVAVEKLAWPAPSGRERAWHMAASAMHQIADLLNGIRPEDATLPVYTTDYPPPIRDH